MNLLDRLLSGEADCQVKLAGGGAILVPIDDSEQSTRLFEQLVKEVIEFDGKGYSIEQIAASGPEPDSPLSMVWISYDEETTVAVQDHPLYDEWSDALDRLKDANDRYREAISASSKVNPAIVEKSRRWLDNALSEYEEVSARLD